MPNLLHYPGVLLTLLLLIIAVFAYAFLDDRRRTRRAAKASQEFEQDGAQGRRVGGHQ